MTSSTRPPGTPGPKPRLGDEPAERLYEAAVKCFARAGFRSTSVGDIAAEAGVSRPLVYRYYASKEALVLEVMTRKTAAILADSAARTAHLEGFERVEEAVVLGALAIFDDPDVIAIASGDTADITAALLNHEQFRGLERGFWQPVLIDAQRLGEVRDDVPVEELIQWIFYQQFAMVSTGRVLGYDRPTAERVTRTLVVSALRPPQNRAGILPRAPGSS